MMTHLAVSKKPALHLEEDGPDKEVADVPVDLVLSWITARDALRKAEDDILRHVLRTGQKAPLVFSYRMGLV